METYAISGMTCAACARKVTTALQSVAPGAAVTLDPPRAVLGGLSVAAANATLAGIGNYRIAPIARPTPAAQALATIGPYYPLLLVIGLIAVAALAGRNWMMGFMAGFYLVFGAFKLLDVPAFAAAYARYDVIARRVPAWGYAYPFIEVAIGFAFLFYVQMGLATWAALILSLIGAVGVIQSVQRRETIPCACLGTVFNLPMSTVTIVENLGMAAMAAWMLTVGM